MKFQYQAKTRAGDVAAGEIEAASLADARQELRDQGLFVTQLAAAGQASLTRRPAAGGIWRRRVAKSDLVAMTSQLSIMCQSGVDLAEAIHNVSQQCGKAAFREILEKVDADVCNGRSFSEALARHPQAFDEFYVASILAAEQSGTMSQVLDRLAYLLRSDLRLRSTIRSLLMYPAVLGAVTGCVLCCLIFFVLPQFATVFETLDKPVPPLTQALLDVGAFARNHAVLLAIGASLAGLAGFHFRHASPLRRAWDYSTLHLAVVRNATRTLLAGRSFRLLGTMLLTGVPLVEGLRLCRNSIANQYFRELFTQAERQVLQGEGLGRSLMNARFLPSGTAQMVVTAERGGKMGEVLKNVGEYLEDEGERCLRDVIKIAEPAVIVFLGIVVAGIVLAVVIPMLDVSST